MKTNIYNIGVKLFYFEDDEIKTLVVTEIIYSPMIRYCEYNGIVEYKLSTNKKDLIDSSIKYLKSFLKELKDE